MANQPEQVQYDAGVYQFETTDPVDGGVGAVSNKPLLNLANRTAYLKQHVDNLENGTLIPPTVAPLNSPGFTGSPTAPTLARGDSSTKLATAAFVQGTVNGVSTVNVAGNANVNLTAVQGGAGILVFTGALTGNIDVIVPAGTSGKWEVSNQTTGAFTLRVKTAAGTGIYVTQGDNTILWCDGTNVLDAKTDVLQKAGGVMRGAVTLFGGDTLATPPAQFDSSAKLASTAFVQSALGNFSGMFAFTGTQVLTAAHAGAYIKFTLAAAANCTLPIMPPGTSFTIMNAQGSAQPLTVNVPGGIGSGASSGNATTIVLQPNQEVVFVSTNGAAAAYDAINGIGGVLLSTSGYQKLPSGLIIQWSQITANGTTSRTFTYPIAFPNALLADACLPPSGGVIGGNGATATQRTFNTVKYADGTALGNAAIFTWIGIGY